LTRWRYAAGTDAGVVRASNQDALYVNSEIAIVADGMGGHAAGEIAAEIAVSTVRRTFALTPTIEGMEAAVREANDEVLKDSMENPDHFGMGTTLIAVGLTSTNSGDTTPTLFHVGDSRAYQLRDGAIRQLTNDHSVAEEWVRLGRMTAEEAAIDPRRHQLTRGIGVERTVAIDVASVSAQAGDRLLLCSDGLSNELSAEKLAAIASQDAPLEVIVGDLITAAKQAGGRDNITAIVVEFDEVTPPDEVVQRTASQQAPPKVATSPVRTSSRRGVSKWRVAGSVGILLAIVFGFFFVLHWYAYSNYYLGNDNGTVAVYQGQPNGVLWFGPVRVMDTTYPVAQLRQVDATALANTITEPSINAALHYAAYMNQEWAMSHSASQG
jgi:protein phosphatase